MAQTRWLIGFGNLLLVVTVCGYVVAVKRP